MARNQPSQNPGPEALEFLAVLGLKPPVTEDDVKQAYMEKAKLAHPDRGGDAAQFVRIQEAFEKSTQYARFKAGRMQWLSGWVEQYAEQQDLLAEIKTLGGEAKVESVDWAAQSIGNDFATVLDRVASISLRGPQIDDALLARLVPRMRSTSGLERLELLDTSVTDAGLAELKVLENLKELDLRGTKVSTTAVETLLESLDRLEVLGLADTGVGWAARLKLKFGHRDLEIQG
jgi:hypothetical protein